jgi:tRNA pseudouridine38-40 synthase
MPPRTVQLVLQYDGAGFAGWQRQPAVRTVQGVLEEAAARLCQEAVPVVGAGRTDAGVHARGQVAGVRVAERWTAGEFRRAMNAVLPDDVWVAASHEMHPEFHARYSATARRYTYRVGLDDEARSPFRRRWSWAVGRPIDVQALSEVAELLVGEHVFRAFAVKGTAPADDEHRCNVFRTSWHLAGSEAVFEIEANRFLHHMVRFLVGTMMDVALGRRPASDVSALLVAGDNGDVSPPAPAHGLYLEHVTYPSSLYLGADA